MVTTAEALLMAACAPAIAADVVLEVDLAPQIGSRPLPVLGHQPTVGPRSGDGGVHDVQPGNHHDVVRIRECVGNTLHPYPANLVDLAIGAELAGVFLHRPVAHPLVAAPAVFVEGLGQFLTDCAVQAGLLVNLANCAIEGGLASTDLALRQ